MINLLTIAKYEALILFRSWKLWVLIIFGTFFPILFNVAFIIAQRMGVDAGWQGLAGAGPYVLFYYFNIFQVIIIIFLTLDFREKDLKVHVDEVMNSRSMTNLEYIFGKYLGIIIPVITLTAVIILLLSVVNRIVNDTWSLVFYMKYFVILNLPALLFITALSIFAAALMRNSFIVFIVIISYTVGTRIVLGYTEFSVNKLWLFVDYVGFMLPLFPSDLLGFMQIDQIIMQRVFYLLLGGFFFGLTVVLFYPRLHQSNFWANSTLFGSLGCLAGAGIIFYQAWTVEMDRRDFRTAILTRSEINNGDTSFGISSYSMEYELFAGESPVNAKVEVAIKRVKLSSENILPFIINPGLKVSLVSDSKGRELSFRQNNINLLITLEQALELGSVENITIVFKGDIDKRVAFLSRKSRDPGILDKQSGFNLIPKAVFPNDPVLLHSDFSYLLPESMWYPQLYNPYMYHYPDKRPVSFFTGSLSVNVPANLIAVASGTFVSVDSLRSKDRRKYLYSFENPLKQITLVAGEYNSFTTNVEGIDFNLYVSKKHSQIVEFFSDITEEIQSVLSDAMRGINQLTGLEYPLSSISYIEVPLTFQWYPHDGLQSESNVQGGLVLLPEYMVATSLISRFEREKEDAEKNEENKSDKEIKKQLFIDIIVNRMFGHNQVWNRNRTTIPAPVGMYWSQRVNFEGEVFPVFEYYYDKFLQQLITNEMKFFVTNQEERIDFTRFGGGRDWNAWEFELNYGVKIDTMYKYVRTTSISEMIPDPESVLYHGMMRFKGEKLHYILKEIVSMEKYKVILKRFLDEYSYKTATVKDFQRICEEVYGSSLDWFFDSWLYGTAFPGYSITAFNTYKIKGGTRGVQYIVDVNVKNGEQDAGFLGVTLKTRGDEIVKKSSILGGQELQFSFLTDDYPEEIIVDPIFSQNQNYLNRKARVPDEFDIKPAWDGIRPVRSLDIETEGIVIDDLDPGFTVINLAEQQYFRPVRDRNEWRPRTNASAFGKYKFTYRNKKKGTGLMSVKWETEIPVTGVYEIQVFIFKGEDRLRSRLERAVASEFTYTVNHSEGSDVIKLSWHAEQHGWTRLGRFHFNGGELASVLLTDDANGNIIADAVRFIPIYPENIPNRQ